MKAHLVVDLGFGDAGKGSVVDSLVRRHDAHTVIRFNGGAQAAHNVVTPDGRHHTFSQFGSGTFVPGVRTHLSRFMLIDPLALLAEERHLQSVGVSDAFARLSIERHAMVVTPFQRAVNRLREMARGDGRHGSCGMGIGETMADSIDHPELTLFTGDLIDPNETTRKLRAMQEYKRSQAAALVLPSSSYVEREFQLLDDPAAPAEFAETFARVAGRFAVVESSAAVLNATGDVVFEGAQGVLLDEWFGFHPYTTWSTTSFANAMTLLKEYGYAGEITRIGVLRAYMTRHGAGPLVTESPYLASRLAEPHNGTNDWQHNFRFGWNDLMMLRYALDIAGGADQLAITCLDHLALLPSWKICHDYVTETPLDCFGRDRLRVAPSPDLGYQERLTRTLATCRPLYDTVSSRDVAAYLQAALKIPVGIGSYGPAHTDKIYCDSCSVESPESNAAANFQAAFSGVQTADSPSLQCV